MDVSGRVSLVSESPEERSVVAALHQQRTLESRAPSLRGPNSEILAGNVRDPGNLESARVEAETSLNQHSTVKLRNSCYFS